MKFTTFLFLIITLFPSLSFTQEIELGTVKLSLHSSTITLRKNNVNIYLSAIINMSIKNNSNSDLKLLLISKMSEILDSDNQKISKSFGSFKSSGVQYSNHRTRNEDLFIKEKQNFVTLSPGQLINAIVSVGGHPLDSVFIRDVSGDFYSTYRPKHLNFNSALAIINIDGTNEIRSFSVTNLPVNVILR